MKKLPILLILLWVSRALAVPAVVQCTGNYDNTYGTSASVTATFGSSVASGDAEFVIISGFFDSITSITDSASNTLTPTSCWAWNGAGSCSAGAALANVTNTPNAITVAVSAATAQQNYISITICEVSGMGSSITLDTGATTTYTGTYGTGLVTASFTTAAANEFGLASITQSSNSTYTMNNGWTAQYSDPTNVAGMVGATDILSSAGSNSIQVTPSAGTTSYIYVLAWEAGGSGGSTPHPPLFVIQPSG